MVNAVDAPALTPQTSSPPTDTEGDRYPTASHERILGCLPMVESIARRVYGSLPPGACMELHDLAQSGLLGLVSAGRCYDSETDVPFSIYARFRIEGEMLDSLRRQDLAPRRLRRWQKQLDSARKDLAAVLQREPTEEELCEKLMISAVEMRRRNLALSGTRMPAPTGKGGEQSEPLSSPDTEPDQICERRQLRAVLDRLIDSLSPRYQQVIRLHYCRHMTMKDIGAEMGVHE